MFDPSATRARIGVAPNDLAEPRRSVTPTAATSPTPSISAGAGSGTAAGVRIEIEIEGRIRTAVAHLAGCRSHLEHLEELRRGVKD